MELKRQVLFDTLRRAAAVDDLLGDLDNILQTETNKAGGEEYYVDANID